MSAPTVYHNPRCGTSRKLLARLADKGVAPEVTEYLKAGWTEAQLRRLLKKMNAGPRDILRRREPLVAELGLDARTDDELIQAMIAHPILVERPILETDAAAVVARPVERADPLL